MTNLSAIAIRLCAVGFCKAHFSAVQHSLVEVPPLHYTLRPAGYTGGGLQPGRRSPGGGEERWSWDIIFGDKRRGILVELVMDPFS